MMRGLGGREGGWRYGDARLQLLLCRWPSWLGLDEAACHPVACNMLPVCGRCPQQGLSPSHVCWAPGCLQHAEEASILPCSLSSRFVTGRVVQGLPQQLQQHACRCAAPRLLIRSTSTHSEARNHTQLRLFHFSRWSLHPHHGRGCPARTAHRTAAAARSTLQTACRRRPGH